MMRNFWKCLVVAGLWGILRGIWQAISPESVSLGGLITGLGFGEIYFIPDYLIELGVLMLPYVLFQILFGTYIYSHFCTASIYYFSRQADRFRWFIKEAAGLYGYCCLFFCALSVFAVLGAVWKCGGISFETSDAVLLTGYVAIHSLWLFVTVMVINLVSIFRGNNVGVLIVMALQFSFVACLSVFDRIVPMEDTGTAQKYHLLLKLDPISHLVMMWHTSRFSRTDARIHLLPLTFDLYISILYFLAAGVLVTLIGGLLVKKKEIMISDMELEGI